MGELVGRWVSGQVGQWVNGWVGEREEGKGREKKYSY